MCRGESEVLLRPCVRDPTTELGGGPVFVLKDPELIRAASGPPINRPAATRHSRWPLAENPTAFHLEALSQRGSSVTICLLEQNVPERPTPKGLFRAAVNDASSFSRDTSRSPGARQGPSRGLRGAGCPNHLLSNLPCPLGFVCALSLSKA